MAALYTAWLGECIALLPKDVPYLYVTDECFNHPKIECKSYGGPNKPPKVQSLSPKCITDKATNLPHCATTCAEMGVGGSKP